ncbi:MAG: hypothetical protein IPM13_15955 [Phycisphaerales bacterium]|nr:hypothetical protein [Phycisphaerales bacterium]
MDAELRKHLTAYADGELPAELRPRIESLLAADAEAQAEVRWWQSLRRQARRVLDAEAVPPGLAAGILRQLRPPVPAVRKWTLRLGVPGVAAAAILLTVFFLVRPAETTPITPASLVAIHDACAVHGRHDSLGVRKAAGKGSCASVKSQAKFACRVPDVSACGPYHLDGACDCAPKRDVRVVHAYFRSTTAPEVVVSAFAIDRSIRFCGSDGSKCGSCRSSKRRQYDESTLQNVSLLCWKEGDRSYVLVARLPAQQLSALADGVTLAGMQRLLSDGREVAVAASTATAP